MPKISKKMSFQRIIPLTFASLKNSSLNLIQIFFAPSNQQCYNAGEIRLDAVQGDGPIYHHKACHYSARRFASALPGSQIHQAGHQDNSR